MTGCSSVVLDNILLIGNHPGDGNESMDRYTNLLLRGLKESGIKAELITPPSILGKLCGRERRGSKWLRYFDKFVMFPGILRRRINQLKSADGRLIVHICDHAEAMYVSHISGLPHLVTCHDLTAVRSALGEMPEFLTRPTGKIYQKWILNSLRKASAVVCVSDATRADCLRLFSNKEQKVFVVKNCLNYPYRPMSKAIAAPLVEDALHRSGATRPENYLFHIGNNEWYKNRIGLIRIYKELTEISKPPPLILAGQELTTQLRQLIQSENLPQHVLAIGKVSNEELNALYAQADALIFPSRMEGFGWPVIEAQACGCPVIASDIDVIHEVAGDGACFIRASDISASAMAIRTFLALPRPEKTALIDKGFQNSAKYLPRKLLEEYIDVYCKISLPDCN
jgi:glycosyltransferase involved in cell wall biosynthesis